MTGKVWHVAISSGGIVATKSHVREKGESAVRNKRKIVYLAFVSEQRGHQAERRAIERTTREMSKSEYVAFVTERRKDAGAASLTGHP